MNRFLKFFYLTKRQKFVISILLLSAGIFISEFSHGNALIIWAVILSILTIFFLFISLKDDLRGTFFYPIFFLPTLYTAAFVLFYPLVPARFLTRILILPVYALGLYSLFLTQNIFAVSAVRTINLMRSARIVSFVLTIIVFFLLANFCFFMRLPVFVSPFVVFVLVFLLNFQSLWSYMPTLGHVNEIFFLTALTSLSIAAISVGSFNCLSFIS